MAGKQHKPRFPLPAKARSGNPWGVDDDWTSDGVDRLFRNDRIRIRQMVSAAGRGSHGQIETLTMRTGKGRKIHLKRPQVIYATVTSVGMKAGRLTVFYAADGDDRTTSGGSLSVAAIIADNKEPVGWRVREVVRHAGFGPSDDVRSNSDPVEHSLLSRSIAIEEGLRITGAAGYDRLLLGDTDFRKDVTPVTMERIEAWVGGSERVPAWAVRAMRDMSEAAGDKTDESPVIDADPAPDTAPDPIASVVETATTALEPEIIGGLRYCETDATEWATAVPSVESEPDEYILDPDADDADDEWEDAA